MLFNPLSPKEVRGDYATSIMLIWSPVGYNYNFMVNEKTIQPPQEDISELELKPLAEVKPEDLKKQKDYEARLKGFQKGLENITKKYKIKIVQIPARIVFYDQKYEK